MDNLVPSTGSLAGPLAALTASGTTITVLTEVAKQYISDEYVPPPLIAALIAAVFTAAWVLSQPIAPQWSDSLQIVLIWSAMFQTSIAVYHATKLAANRRALRRVRRAAEPPEEGGPTHAG